MDEPIDLEKSREVLLEIIRKVRSPAGPDPRFAGFDSIKANYREFIPALHAGMRELHEYAIGSLIKSEEELETVGDDEEHRMSIELLRQFFYQVNNALAWTILQGERHVARRLCSFSRNRPKLSKSNPESVLHYLAHINKDPNVFGMWADATSFIDSGDVLISYPLNNRYELRELKQRDDHVWGFPHDIDKSHIKDFEAGHNDPKEGAKRTERLRFQLSKMRKLDQIIKSDVGIDPFINVPVRMHDTDISDEHFDMEISKLMAKARSENCAVRLIDGCLWVGVYYDHNPKLRLAFAGSAATVFTDDPDPEIFRPFAEHVLENTVLFTQASGHWLARPAFLFDMPEEDVLDLLLGKAKVRMFFHWESWGELLKFLDIEFEWMDMRDFRKTSMFADLKSRGKEVETISGRVPMLKFEGNYHYPASHHMYRMYSDFLHPTTLAELAEYWAKGPDFKSSKRTKEESE